MGIFKTVDAAGKASFSDRGVGKQYTPGTSVGVAPISTPPFAEQAATSYTPKSLNAIGAARSQLTRYQNNLTASGNQMSQVAVSGIQPVTFDTSKGGNITQAAGLESDALFNTPEIDQHPTRIEGQAAQLSSPSGASFNPNWAGNKMGRYGGNDNLFRSQ